MHSTLPELNKKIEAVAGDEIEEIRDTASSNVVAQEWVIFKNGWALSIIDWENSSVMSCQEWMDYKGYEIALMHYDVVEDLYHIYYGSIPGTDDFEDGTVFDLDEEQVLNYVKVVSEIEW